MFDGRGESTSPRDATAETAETAEANLMRIRQEEDARERRADLENELESVRHSIVGLERQIQAIKEARGWFVRPGKKKVLGNGAHAEVWRGLVERGEVAWSWGGPKRQGAKSGRGGKSGGRGGRRGREGGASGLIGKRGRKPTAKERRVMSIWAQCVTILNALKKHRYAWPFLEAVDPVALNIPDYLDVVKRPMDLGEVSRRVAHEPEKGIYRQYGCPAEFRDDVRQIWSNCRAYNRPGQDVRAMGDFLSEMWEKRWCQSEIEEKWNAEEGGGSGQGSTSAFSSVNGSLNTKGRRGPPGGDNPNRELTFLDKRRLAQQIGSLHGPQLSGIAEILLSSGVQESDDEMVLDMEQLETRTLWRLKQYVDGIHSARKKGKGPVKKSVQMGKTEVNGVEQCSSQMLESATVDSDAGESSDLSLGTT
ncbi:unnamed protein product [Ostreobium quekettii]|uniref:Bromodomain-containing protein n=1 Tax=Ostreobium quekettii TaxID=121088 RepID=A0A8S1J290_9CHLO|nr:unnamed protein product [Ostreobium quekettii]|eukprot:evm.model.scf_86.4 EVM.evm.TU.scf_86.4   scf_86:31083-34434(-)